MTMKYLVTIILVLVVKMSIAQTVYKDSIFSGVNKTTYSYGTDELLKFDYYKAEEAKGPQPLIVFVHGGGFFMGVRDDETLQNFATKLAQCGYAVASVSYRLTMKDIGFGCNVETAKKIAAIDSASYDVSVAIKHLLDNNDTFLIDKNNIILVGSSAGAEVVLNMAYVYDNKILPSKFSYAGVVSFAGALTTLENVHVDTAIPTQLFHGTGDKLVPYSIAPHHYCNQSEKGYLMLYGSESIAKRLKGLGASYYFLSANGGSHDWSRLPMVNHVDEVVDFLYHDIINVTSIRQTDRNLNDLSMD